MAKHAMTESPTEKLESFMRFQVKHFMFNLDVRLDDNKRDLATWNTLNEIKMLAHQTFEDWL